MGIGQKWAWLIGKDNYISAVILLVLQSFGKENEYRRAIFAIWSYLAHYRADFRVFLFTDSPNFFQPYFIGHDVTYVLLTPEKIKRMRGEIDFLHRMKIALIEDAFSLSNSDLLYIDSDTFFISDPFDLVNKVGPNDVFMHSKEYAFEEIANMPLPAGETFQSFVKLIDQTTFQLPFNRSIKVNSKQFSWNAGAMFFHSSHSRLLPDVYALTDQFYPPTKNHASEQYAFSIVLQNNLNIMACDSVIYHYWYRVRKKIMDDWLSEKISVDWAKKGEQEKLKLIIEWTEILPSYIENDVLTLRDEAIQSFHANRFLRGYWFAIRAILKAPLNGKFIIDVLYHTKRLLSGRSN